MGDHPFPFLDKCIPVVKTVVIVELCAAAAARHYGAATPPPAAPWRKAQVMTRQETLRPLYCDMPGNQHLTTKYFS